MKKYIPIYILLFCLASVFAVSCSGVKKCAPPQLDLPAQLASGAAGDTLTLADIYWWTFYGDSALCRIIRATLDNNKNLLAAAARVEELQQLYRIDRVGLSRHSASILPPIMKLMIMPTKVLNAILNSMSRRL